MTDTAHNRAVLTARIAEAQDEAARASGAPEYGFWNGRLTGLRFALALLEDDVCHLPPNVEVTGGIA